MLSLATDFLLSAMAVAGLAVLWRNWLADHPHWQDWLENHFKNSHKALTCGSCFTYWLSLVFTITAKPLAGWMPFHSWWPINLAAQWLALAWLSVFLRFLYIALQELVSYQVHNLKNHTH